MSGEGRSRNRNRAPQRRSRGAAVVRGRHGCGCGGGIRLAPRSDAAGRIEPEIAGGKPTLSSRRVTQIGEFRSAGYCEERLYVYLATGLEGSEQSLDDDEEIEVVRMPFADAVARVHSGEIDDAKSIITILLAATLVQSKG